MKKVVAGIVIGLGAAAAGWIAGTLAVPDQPSQDGAGAAPPRVSATVVRATVNTWESQIPAVRAAAGARAEYAWIRWAFSIPDKDVPAAIASLNPRSDFHALRCLYARWTRLDPVAALASFRQSAIPAKVSHFYMPTPEDEDQSRGLVDSTLTTSPRSTIASRMLASLASKDPEAARALAKKINTPGTPEANEFPYKGWFSVEMDRLLKETPGSNTGKAPPVQAAAEAAALTDPAGKRTALLSAAWEWFPKDPAAAAAWMRALPKEDRWALDFESMDFLFVHASPRDCAVTAGLLLEDRSISAEDIRNAYKPDPRHHFFGDERGIVKTIQAVEKWAGQDPAAAQQWLGSLPDGDLKAAFAGAVAGMLAHTNADAAIALLNQTGGDQSLAIAGLMRGWLETDVRAALAWTEKMDDVPLRDASRHTAAIQIADTDPALALETALTISDAAMRSTVFKRVQEFVSWNPAALAALQTRFPGEGWSK